MAETETAPAPVLIGRRGVYRGIAQGVNTDNAATVHTACYNEPLCFLPTG